MFRFHGKRGAGRSSSGRGCGAGGSGGPKCFPRWLAEKLWGGVEKMFDNDKICPSTRHSRRGVVKEM